MSKFNVGVVVGRFQVPDLHEEHKKLLLTIFDNHDNILILLGVNPMSGLQDNPLDYPTRYKMIQAFIDKYLNDVLLNSKDKTIIIQPIPDNPTNKGWSKNIDKIIRVNFPHDTVCLYGGRDSFIPHYTTKTFNVTEMPSFNHVNGSAIRVETGSKIFNSKDFRSGVVYSTQNKFPTIFPTVDIAVVKKCSGITAGTSTITRWQEIILCQKPDFDGLVFPGGFVDVSDKTYEEAACRELHEEVGMIETGSFEYVTSAKIPDWRITKNGNAGITTTLFMTEYLFGALEKCEEEFTDIGWYKLDARTQLKIAPCHKELYNRLFKKLVPFDTLIFENKDSDAPRVYDFLKIPGIPAEGIDTLKKGERDE